MATPRPDLDGTAARDPREQERREGQEKMPPSPLRNALQLLHVSLLFNGEEGIDVGSALSSIEDKVGIRPRPALDEAVRLGLVEVYTDFLGRSMVRRGLRSAELLPWIYGRGDPPTRESVMAGERAFREALDARDARLRAIREAARPREHNTADSLPAWVP